MKQTKRTASAGQNRKNPAAFDFLLAFVSVCALAATFLLSYTNYDYKTKSFVFSGITILYLAFCVFNYKKRKPREDESARFQIETEYERNIENKLFALEEANEYFGAALKPADMLRLVSSRVEELVPFDACVFFVADENGEILKTAFAYGENVQSLKNLEISADKSVAGKTFKSGTIQIDENLRLDERAFPPNLVKGFQTTIAAPLVRGGEIAGVLQLFSREINVYDAASAELLKAVAERIAPLFAGSIAFERSLSNALTDSLTALPNERAFYLVLENQIAESTRFQLERPLTILCADINDFSEFNRKFGHATGDKFLTFTGETIKNQLRQMDFLARSAGDEFLIVLPTASERIAREIIERIERSFAAKPFEASENEKVHVKLNFGSATFGRDGETAAQLLRTAALRKRQAKSSEPGKVLWFPKEYAN